MVPSFALGTSSWCRLHVFASTPYSFGMLLWNRLYQAFGRDKVLVPYQFDYPSRSWKAWGATEKSPSKSPAFANRLQWTGEVPAERQPDVRHVALAISLTRRLIRDEMERNLVRELQDAKTVWVEIGIDPVSQQSITPEHVEPTVADLQSFFFKAVERFPGATIHLFFSGPVVILMRASSKIHMLARPIIVYERIGGGAGFEFIPVVRFEAPRLLVGPGFVA